MSSDVHVSFDGDTRALREQVDAARRSVAEALGKMKDSAETANPAIAQLQRSLDKLSESSERTAESTSTLLTYQNWAFVLSVASAATTVMTSTVRGLYSGTTIAAGGIAAAATKTADLTSEMLAYTRSQAYLAQYLPVVRVENDGLIASIGRASIAWNSYWKSVEIVKSGLLGTVGSAVAASGGMERLSNTARQSNFDNATRAIQAYLDQLFRIPSMTNEAASSIVASFSSIPNSSAQMIQVLVDVTAQLSTSKEQAQSLAEQLTRAMSDPATSGEAFLTSQKDITAELLKQFDAAKRSGNVSEMQSAILQEMIVKERSMLDEKTRALREQLKTLSEIGLLGRVLSGSYKTQVEEANKALDAINKQVTALDAASARLRQMPTDMNQAALAARGIVNELSPLTSQLESINGKLSTMRQVFGGFGGNLKGTTGDVKELIAQFEGFREKAYWDKNAFRVGYGSDTTTRADGRVERVTQDTIVSREDAERDLARRVVEFQNEAAAKIGASWDGLSDRAKASITSVVYNYGSTSPALDKMYTAAGTGSDKLIADAIRELKANPDRRYQEAANITNSQPGATLASGIPATPADIEAMARLKDNAQGVADALRGGNEVAQAQAQILSRNAAGQKDSVRDAQQLVEAWKTDLANSSTASARLQMQNGLRAAQVSLAEKLLEVDKSKLAVSGVDDTTAKEKLATAKKMYDIEMRAAGDDVALKNAALAKKKSAEQSYETEITKIAKEAEDVKYAIAQAGLEQRKAKLREDKDHHIINAQQKLAAELQIEAEQTRLEQSHYQKIKSLEEEGTAEYRAAQNKMTLIAAESAARRQQILSQDARNIQRSYDRVFNQIGSTLTSSIMGMIQGTSTIRQLFQNLALQIVQLFVKAGVDMVMTWGATQARMLMQTVTGQASQTAAVTAGASAKVAAQTTGAVTGAAVEKTAALTTISTDAAKAAAGAYSSVVGIPIIGPVLAPAAAAVAYGAVAAFGSFDTGAWSIPHDQLAMVHAGEMIVPSRGGIAEEFRSMLGGDMSGKREPSHTYNVNFVDTAGAKTFIRRYGEDLARAVSKHLDQNPSARPGY